MGCLSLCSVVVHCVVESSQQKNRSFAQQSSVGYEALDFFVTYQSFKFLVSVAVATATAKEKV